MADRWRKVALWLIVVVAHGALFAVVARSRPEAFSLPPSPPIDITLFTPPAIIPDVPLEAPPAEVAGGGAPAAPSVVRPAKTPPPEPPEVVAPAEPAPEPPTTVVGVSPQPATTPGQGQGGQGVGRGGGTGDGVGRGSGTIRARPIRQASMQELRSLHPPEARGRSGRVFVTCEVQLDTRLDRCRVTSETPTGLGFGAAGLAAATRFYRFTPYVRDGREVPGDITVVLEFGRPPR